MQGPMCCGANGTQRGHAQSCLPILPAARHPDSAQIPWALEPRIGNRQLRLLFVLSENIYGATETMRWRTDDVCKNPCWKHPSK